MKAAAATIAAAALTTADRRQPLDVQWVATPHDVASVALEWAAVGAGDLMIELGCGDGRVAMAAARRGARAICVERDLELAAEARALIDSNGLSDRVDVQTVDMFEANVTEITVAFLFLLPELNARLRRDMLSRAPRLRAVVSHRFEVYGWPCGERIRVDDALFLKWEAPFAAAAAGELNEDDEAAAIVEHALDCGVAEDVGD